MKPKPLYLILIIFLTALVLLVKLKTYNPKSISESPSTLNVSGFIEMELFAKGEAFEDGISIDYDIKGMIVPHHMLASRLLSSAFSAINFSKIKTIIILGPDHEQDQSAFAKTTNSSFETVFGRVEADTDAVNKLLEGGLVKRDDRIFEREHSIGIPINYISRYSEKVKVIPVAVNETRDLEDIKELVVALFQLMDEETLVLASIDLSHNLSQTESMRMDIETLDALRKKDYTVLNSFGPEHLDSSTTLILADMLMASRGCKIETLRNTNSAVLVGHPQSVTSYMVGFYK